MTCQQCRHNRTPLTLAPDGRMLCDSCTTRQQRALTRLAAAVNRGRSIVIDLEWIHPADRRSAAALLTRRAKTAPERTGMILQNLAGSLRTSTNGIITCDITSIDDTTVRTVASILETELDREVTTSGADKTVLIALVAAWDEWQRHHAQET